MAAAALQPETDAAMPAPLILLSLLLALHLAVPTALCAEEAARVNVQSASALIIHPAREAPAVAEADRDALLAAEVAGLIAEVPVRVGDRLEAGAPIAVLAEWESRLQLRQAEARLAELRADRELAGRQLARARALREDGQASEELLDGRSMALRAAKARETAQEATVALTRMRLEKRRVLAPFAGEVTERHAQPGAWAAPGTPLIRLIDPEDLTLAARLSPGQWAHFVSPEPLVSGAASGAVSGDGPGTRWTFRAAGREYAVVPDSLSAVASPADSARRARLRFTDERPPAWTAGRLVWADPAPHLPAHLLVRRAGSLGVFLLEAGRARFQPLPEAREGRPARLPAAFSTEALVVLDGREGLVDGQAAQPSEPAPGTGTASAASGIME